ncbi:unnamed protein product [Merluccius merluccius]
MGALLTVRRRRKLQQDAAPGVIIMDIHVQSEAVCVYYRTWRSVGGAEIKQLKRKRKSNYSVRETQTLIREIHKRQDVLFSRQQNTAINELKRQAWEEVAGGVNALGEGELRTAAEVKRRYLDWRALMKRKQLRAQLSACLSSASSLALKEEYEPPSPGHEHDAAMLGSACDQLLDLSGFPKDHHCNWQELVALGEPSGHAMMMMTASGVKTEEDASEYRTDSEVADGDGELDEDDGFPSLLGEMASPRGEVCVPEVYCHIDELGMLASSSSSSKAPTSTTPTPNTSIGTSSRDDFLPAGLAGAVAGPEGVQPPLGPVASSGFENTPTTSMALLFAMEKQRLEMERQRLAVETERLAMGREHLAVERERLQTERERCHVERERLRALLLLGQARRSAEEPAQQGPPSSSTAPDGRKEQEGGEDGGGPGGGQGWWAGSELETERLRLEKERLQLEKERLQFFKFESGRLQMERERLQVEKERMLLQKDQH